MEISNHTEDRMKGLVCLDRIAAVVLVFLVSTSIESREASAKGTFHLWTAWSPASRAEAATGTSTSSPAKATTTETLGFGGCGGKRQRDPNSHRCRGPADFGN
jgi:hypothetical protein